LTSIESITHRISNNALMRTLGVNVPAPSEP
jgi:hypothetical protein